MPLRLPQREPGCLVGDAGERFTDKLPDNELGGEYGGAGHEVPAVHLPAQVREAHGADIDGEVEPQAECRRVGERIARHAIDVAFIGIGENGHLAFNDPPADFETDEAYLIVEPNEACRRQQLGEGWFPTLADVPRRAISMSIRQIMKSATIVCSVPDLRKARAVEQAIRGPVTPILPASMLQRHPAATIYLDPQSASLLK